MLYKRFFLSAVLLTLGYFSSFSQIIPSFTVSKSGKGKQPVILLAGLSCSYAVWDETVKSLGPGTSNYAISFAGFAGNQPQASPYLNSWESDIMQFIRSNKIDKPVLIGHSLGGMMALDLAAKNPGIFSRIVILDAFPCLPALYDPSFTVQVNMDFTPFINQFAKMDSMQFLSLDKQMLADTSKLQTLLNWSLKSDRNTMGYAYGAMLNKDLRTDLSAIDCPALIMLQPAMKVKEAEILKQYAQLKNATIRYATKGLHFIMYDDREWYLSTLQSFLQQ